MLLSDLSDFLLFLIWDWTVFLVLKMFLLPFQIRQEMGRIVIMPFPILYLKWLENPQEVDESSRQWREIFISLERHYWGAISLAASFVPLEFQGWGAFFFAATFILQGLQGWRATRCVAELLEILVYLPAHT